MVLGDIRGEEIPTIERPVSAEEALLGAAGSTLGLGAAVFGPVASLGLMWGVGHGLTGVTNRAGMALSSAGRAALPYAKVAGRYARNTIEGGLAAVRREGFLGDSVARMAAAGTAAIAAGKAGLAAAGAGLGVAGAGLRGVVSTGSALAPFATTGAIAGGMALGAYQAHRDNEAERQAFAASSNAYMARGAANRNRSQGRY